MRKWLNGVLVAALLWVPGSIVKTQAFSVAAMQVPPPQVSIQLDQYPLPDTSDVMTYKDRVLVPFRTVATAMGLQVQWDSTTGTMIGKNGDTEIRFQAGNHMAQKDGNPVPLDAEPLAGENDLYVPVRALSEAIGAGVQWNQSDHTVQITSQPRHLHTMVFYGLGSYSKRAYLPKFDEATFAWAALDGDGKLSFAQNEYSWPTGGDDLLTAVKSSKVGTSLMVYSVDQQGELSKLIQSDARTHQFADDLLAKLTAEGMDSATLDFETLGDPKAAVDVAKVRAEYASFVQTVAAELHAHGKKLNVVMAPLNGWYQGYDYQAIGQAVDQLYVMAYSYVDDKVPQPLDKIDEALREAEQVVDPSKLTLGINVYSETDQTVLQKIGLAKRYHLNGVGFWLLKLLDDHFVQAVDSSLQLHPSVFPGPPVPESVVAQDGQPSRGSQGE